jgi:hypothetical protein
MHDDERWRVSPESDLEVHTPSVLGPRSSAERGHRRRRVARLEAARNKNRFAATSPGVRRGSSEECELRLAARKAVLLTETDGHQRASGPPAKEPSLNWHLAPTLRFQRKTGSGEGSRHRLIESKSWVPFADRRGAQPGVEWIAPRSGCVLVVSVPLAAAREPLSCGGATTQWRSRQTVASAQALGHRS